MSDETTLLPCPFCGGEAIVTCRGRGRYQTEVMCSSCSCRLWQMFGSRAEAIAAWNARAERTCEETTVDKFFRGCGSCGYMWEYMYGIGTRKRPDYCPNCGARVVDA